jgi:hypothetical protein
MKRKYRHDILRPRIEQRRIARRRVAALRVHRPVHILSRAVDQLAGGVHKLAEPLFRPRIKIIARVDRKPTCLAKHRPVTDAGILRKSRGYAWDAVSFADVARGISAPHVIWGAARIRDLGVM